MREYDHWNSEVGEDFREKSVETQDFHTVRLRMRHFDDDNAIEIQEQQTRLSHSRQSFNPLAGNQA